MNLDVTDLGTTGHPVGIGGHEAPPITQVSTCPNAPSRSQRCWTVFPLAHDKARSWNSGPLSNYSKGAERMRRATTPQSTDLENQTNTPKRARVWSFTSQFQDPLTGAELFSLERLQMGLDMRSTGDYLFHREDQDPCAYHLQGALRMQNSRTGDQVADWLGLPRTCVIPLTGRGAFERYILYLLGLSPEAVAKGKAKYPVEGVHSNFDWQTCLERYFGRPAVISTLPTLTQVRIAVFDGTMTVAEVQAAHPALYVTRYRELEALAEKGQTQRRQAEDNRQRAEAAEREARERPRREREARQRAEAARVEWERQQAAHELRDRQERARITAELEAQRLAVLAEQATPEYKARQVEAERRDLVDQIAIAADVKGSRLARERGVAQLAREYELSSADHLLNGYLTHHGAVLLFADLCLDIGDAVSLDVDEVLPDVRVELATAKADLASLGRRIAVAEFHAADGNEMGFERALQLRREYVTYTDLVNLPAPRADIQKLWRDALTNVDPRMTPTTAATALLSARQTLGVDLAVAVGADNVEDVDRLRAALLSEGIQTWLREQIGTGSSDNSMPVTGVETLGAIEGGAHDDLD